MRFVGAILSIALALQSTPSSPVQKNMLRIAFRYDQDRVISFVHSLDDPVPITMSSLKSMETVPNPVATYGVCGYPLRLTETRLHTFTPDPGKIPRLGQRMTVLIGGDSRINATVDGYVEVWNGDRTVSVEMLARVPSSDIARFQAASTDYFLIADVNSPSQPPVVADAAGVQWKSTKTLNRFGAMGEIVLRIAEAGWSITLFREDHGKLRPTDVADGCGD